ncbi:MAG: FecR domain-containing protein [Polyangiaceae bacterium]|nr:FecR domain-containing protein [Polyangiaceae bacterium]
MTDTEHTSTISCADVEEHLAEVLEGTAPEALYEHIADCDRCRDLRHDAEAARDLVGHAGADYRPGADLAERVERAARARAVAPSPGDVTAQAVEPSPANATPAGAPTRRSEIADKAEFRDEGSESPNAVARRSLRRLAVVLGGAVLAAASAALWLRGASETKPGPGAAAPPWNGTIAHVLTAGGGASGVRICRARDAGCFQGQPGSRVAAGASIATDALTRVHVALSDGTVLVLDRSTELELGSDRGRRARLRRGMLVADVAASQGPAMLALPHGQVEVLGTKFAVTTAADWSTVDVSRGTVRLVDDDHRSVTLRAGDQGRLDAGLPPYVSAASGMAEAFAWSEQATSDEAGPVAVRGLGELKARRPGSDQERDGVVTLAAHSVKVRISGSVARTEIDETFSNQSDEVLEGIYRFPLPPGAQIERLALEVDGKLEEGAFVDRDRAAAIWRGAIVHAAPKARRLIHDDIVWVPGPWRDPALLEWQRGGRFELKIYPIPKRGSRRIVLAYTEQLAQRGGLRRYTYPLAHDPAGTTKVGRFAVDLEVRGHDARFPIRSHGYPLEHTHLAELDRFSLSQAGFVPSGDLSIEYAEPHRDAALAAWTYQPEPARNDHSKPKADLGTDDPKTDLSSPYVALALRPKLPRGDTAAARSYVFVVDSSRSMYGESYQRASAVAVRTIRELDPTDRATVLACHVECNALPAGFLPAGAGAAKAAEEFLRGIEPHGGSDLSAAVEAARRLGAREEHRELRLILVGDGTPTVGPIRPAHLARAVRESLKGSEVELTAVAIGGGADLDTLGAMAQAGGGVVLPYVPGQTTAEAAFALLAATCTSTLRDVRVTLPDGLFAVAPSQVDNMGIDAETIVVARMARPNVEGSVMIRGKLGSKDFERRYPVRLVASTAKGNAFVARLYAAERVRELERSADPHAKPEAIALSKASNVASRFTSLLVLESPAMFRAFGLENTRVAPEWTGEDATENAEVGEDDSARDKDDSANGLAGIGGSVRPGAGSGPVYGAAASSRPKRAAKAAPPASVPPQPAPAADEVFVPRPSERPSLLSDPLSPIITRPRPRLVPMRRIWERRGRISTGSLTPKAASFDAIAEAERAFSLDENRRENVRALFSLYFRAAELDKADTLATRWAEKAPLDPDALTALADLAARKGRRDAAIRILSGVVDVRPDDLKAQQRLARLHRWANNSELGCRHAVAIAELRTADAAVLADAVRCSRHTSFAWLGDALLSAAGDTVRQKAEALLTKEPASLDTLRGDVRLEARWRSGADLDLALIDPDGRRVSWLGAPTRSVISARDVTSDHQEGLALRGAKPGDYVIEISRASGDSDVSGEVAVSVAGTKKTLPFTLVGDRVALAVATVSMVPRLVPVRSWREGVR